MISEGSCDTEDWMMLKKKNQFFHHRNKLCFTDLYIWFHLPTLLQTNTHTQLPTLTCGWQAGWQCHPWLIS